METDKVFAGAVPQIYDRCMGPLKFQPYAELIAERLGEADRRILETAAGTGVVTLAILAKLPESSVVATDLNQAMLDVAAEKAPAGRVTWQQADAQSLPFDSGSFDVVVCSFGVMFMPDKAAAHREARRVLRPGGRFVFTAWDRIDTNPLMHITEAALIDLFPADPPRFFSRTPCGYHDPARIERELREAGFTSVRVEQIHRDSGETSAWEPAMGMCQGSPLRGEIEARDPDGLARATEAVAAALRARFGSGSFRAPMQAVVATAS